MRIHLTLAAATVTLVATTALVTAGSTTAALAGATPPPAPGVPVAAIAGPTAEVRVRVERATLDTTGTRLMVAFLVGGPSPCVGTERESITAEAVYTASTATLHFTEHYAGPPAKLPVGARCARGYYAEPRQTVVLLTEPLGSRSLVDADGTPIPVIEA